MTLLLQNRRTDEEALCLLSHLPFLGLIDAKKNFRLVNKKMRKGKGESKGTGLSKVEKFKWLLRNKVNKANILRSKTKEEEREEWDLTQ